ncbi:MAG: response regulator transcription factor [Subdoligranulum variabile]|nr:response regulator transcription factor [Subdoligranulum variabile]
MIRVMIVEDQKLVRSLLESYIQNEDGYQLAVSIPGAAEAPILCDTEDIDLVLMDVQTEHRLWYKDGDEGTLMQVVRRTMAGEHIFPDAPPSVEIGTAMSAEFTKGEMKVLRCLVRGLSYNEIAKELGIEPSTVKYHVINMLQKTNLENKLQLAIAATEAKLVVELAEE